jgi:hypothetical protein
MLIGLLAFILVFVGIWKLDTSLANKLILSLIVAVDLC